MVNEITRKTWWCLYASLKYVIAVVSSMSHWASLATARGIHLWNCWNVVCMECIILYSSGNNMTICLTPNLYLNNYWPIINLQFIVKLQSKLNPIAIIPDVCCVQTHQKVSPVKRRHFCPIPRKWQQILVHISWCVLCYLSCITRFGPRMNMWPLWPSDAIWRQRSGSTLAQAKAFCLTAPSHYLNQCWFIISTAQ